MKAHYAAVRYPRSATSAEEMLEMRRRAWRQQGLVVVPIDAITDDWLRQALENWAAGMYGPRGPELSAKLNRQST